VVDCLDDNAASEFVSGSLPKTSVTRVETHLAGCRDCRMLVAALAADASFDSQAATRQHEKMPSGSSSSSNGGQTKIYSVGDRVGRYLVLSTLGAGGMGVVFSAYDRALDRKVALKLLRGNIGVATKEARARLRREAQAIAQLSHPNVVHIYDVNTTEDGDLYIAMEFIEGLTVSQWLKVFQPTWREKLDVFLQAARGLSAAHASGLLHRDFKPDNVLRGDDGRVRVTDFGLARSLLGIDVAEDARRISPTFGALGSELTATGTVLGTPRYMPPEQLVGPDIDQRSDQFSFCVALYEALYAKHPLPGATAVGMLERNERALAAPESTDVPAWVGKVVARGLERERSKRYPTMAELMTELAPAPARSRARVAATLAAALVIVGGSTAAALEWGNHSGEASPGMDQWAITELNRIEAELKTVTAQRDALEEQLENYQQDHETIGTLLGELKKKDEQILDLAKQIVQLKNQLTAAAAAGDHKPSHDEAVSHAVEELRGPIRGCFLEWQDRNPLTDVKVVVRAIVGKEGLGREATGELIPQLPKDGPVLGSCVALQVEQAHYPYGNYELEVLVTASWAKGTLALSTVVQPHTSLLDL
jgi:serine/threonine protein kinase